MRFLICFFCLFGASYSFSQERVAAFPLTLTSYDTPNVFTDNQLQQHFFIFYNQRNAEWEYHITDLQFKAVAVVKRFTSSQIKIKAIWQDTANIYTLYQDSKWIMRLLMFHKGAQTFSINPLSNLELQGKTMAIGVYEEKGIILTHIKKKNAVQVYLVSAAGVQADKLFAFPADVDAKKAAKAETLYNTRELDKLEEYAESSKIYIEDQKIYISTEQKIEKTLSTDVFTLDMTDGSSHVNTCLYPRQVKERSVAELLQGAQTNSY